MAPFGQRQQLTRLFVTIDQLVWGERVVVHKGVKFLDHQYIIYYTIEYTKYCTRQYSKYCTVLDFRESFRLSHSQRVMGSAVVDTPQ